MSETGGGKGFTLKHALVIATIGLAPLLGNLDGSIVMIASPVLAGVFHTDPAGISMVIVAYLLVTAAFALIFGKLGDIFGASRVFMMGFAVLTAGSLLCGMAPGLNYLVAFRVVQALGSTMLFSTSCAVVATSLPEEIRGRAFGFAGVLGSIGFAIGAPVGGFVLKHLSWHWLFLFNIPFGLAGLVMSFIYLRPRGETRRQKEAFDGVGAFLSVITCAALVAGLNRGQGAGWSNPLALALLAASLAGFCLFIARERSFPTPLVDMSLFRTTSLAAGIAAALLTLILLDGVFFLFPYYLELVKKISPEKAGLLLMALPAAVVVFSPLAGYLSDRKSPRALSSIAAAAVMCSCVLFTLLKADTSTGHVLMAIALFGVSFAFFFVSNTTLIMSHALPGKEGVLSAVLAVINNVGALVGVSLFQIAFSMNLTGHAGDFHTTPPGVLMEGFRGAMLLAALISIPALISSLAAREKR